MRNDNYVVLLGTKGGPAIRPGSTMPTANLLCAGGRPVVVDCGLGVTQGLVRQGVQLRDLWLVIVTHLHSDHYLELGPMLHTAWTAGLKTRVDVWGPAGLAEYWQAFVTSMKADIDLRIEDEGRPDLRTLVFIHTIAEGPFLKTGGISVSALRNVHPPLVETYALALEWDGRRVVFSGDTAFFPPLAAFARGADLLVHEAMLAEGLEALVKRVGNGDDRLMHHLLRSHTLAQDAARLASMAGVRALALNHLVPSDDPDFTEDHWRAAVEPHWSGTFHLGHDGLRIDV